MSQLDTPINFVMLLKEHSQIRIPIIQRDYAQGRKAQSDIREEFIDVLFTALTSETGGDSSSVNLDFVYGSISDSSNPCFLPLDGQQRLTTLFLLHWYLAWKDGYRDAFIEYFVDSNTSDSRFAYQIRRSSTDFFNALAIFTPRTPANSTDSVKKVIIDEPWYFRSWRFDSTVQSSLTMLEAIHKRFRSVKQDLFSRLIDENDSPITFQLLNLRDFKLNDDLYIKMNARGIPLTPFETLKARYAQHLDTIITDDFREFNLDGHNVSVTDYFARRMDTKWADFFWHHRNRKTNLYDKAVVNFFRVAAMITREPSNSESYLTSLGNFRDGSISSTYSNFSQCGWLDRSLAEGIILLLDIWSADSHNNFAKQLPSDKYFDEVTIFKLIVNNPIKLTFVTIVQLAGYFLYLREHEKDIYSQEFEQWMRVVFNLSVNHVYNDLNDVRRSVLGLSNISSKISSESGETLKYFANPNNEIFGFNEQQKSEERVKATLLLRNDYWVDLIREAEEHGYFRGQIKFLLDFSGIFKEVHDIDNIELDFTSNCAFQNRFRRYFELANSMFGSSGLINIGDFRWERALLTIGDYLLLGGLNHSFLVNDRGNVSSWKRLLRDDTKQRDVLHKLWDRLEGGSNISDQLNDIINNCQNLEPWRLEFVNLPAAIQYCSKRSIRKDKNTGVIFLLRSTQMNGRNVELFTYCLYCRLKSTNFEGISPNWKISYPEVYGTWLKPGMQLTCYYETEQIDFKIEYDGINFVVFFIAKSSLPNFIDILENKLKFEHENSMLKKVVGHSEVIPFLKYILIQFNSNSTAN